MKLSDEQHAALSETGAVTQHDIIMPADTVFDVRVPQNAAITDVQDSSSIFDEDFYTDGNPVPGYQELRYMPWGADNELPFRLMQTISSDEVLSQNLYFNILTAYGGGLKYVDRSTQQPSENPAVEEFMLHNSLDEFFLEQCTDIKAYYFAVAVLILSKDGEKIVQIRHKDACYCRFEKADRKGRINHVFFANWRRLSSLTKKDVEMVTLLDEKDPLGHLQVLLGKAPGADGQKRERTTARKFAVVMKFPTPGQRYYPTPYYSAIFRGDWFDLKRLIGKAKKAKIRNSASVKYHVEINREYWTSIFESEGIHDKLKQAERVKKEKENIKNFITGSENAGKVWISSYYVDSYGNEKSMVRITRVDTSKEGGDWSEDIQETSNMLCYAWNVHPNMVGATPGKSQSNNSGSDKRELFTLKQSLETAIHDMLLKVHKLVIHYNKWHTEVKPYVPLILLTTLDKNTDAVRVNSDGSTSNPNEQ